MAFSALIEGLDRLTVKSVLRGSTATIIGIIGTLTILTLCLIFYIPPTASILKGEYIQTEFSTRKFIKTQFYSNDDFKLAIVFRNRNDNSIANHSQIMRYALSVASEYVGAAYYKNYIQPAPLCKDSPNYFKGIKDFNPPQDCFIFPEYSLFNVLKEREFYSYIYLNVYAQQDVDPFASAGGAIQGFQGRMAKLLKDYYYQVLFTSKIINPNGQTEIVINSFYSSQSEPTSQVRTSWSDIYFIVRNTTMDVSILPWNNYQTKSYISWNGQFSTNTLLGEASAAKNGVEVGFAPSDSNINSFRYYKKIDLMIGYIGGAMLLFYLILWVPFNYINKTIHQIRNTRSLLLIINNKQQNKNELKKLPLSDDDVAAATPNICLYFLSNFLTNMLSKSIRQEYQLIMQGQRQLDIITIVKKLKVTERNLKKHNLYKNFKEKLLCFSERGEDTQMSSINISESERSEMVEDDDIPQQIYQDQDFKEEIVDSKYELTDNQKTFLREGGKAKELYSVNQTAMIIMEDQNGSAELREINCKKKYTDQDKQNKRGIIRSILRFFAAFFEFFDFFGAKPNLIATPHGSSFVGLLTILLIIALTGLTAGVTLSLRNQPQIQTVEQFQEQDNHSIQLTPSVDFNLVMCTPYISYLEGSNRYAYFRFFYENQKGRTYYTPSKLTSSEYEIFEISQSQSPVNIQYCYIWKSQQSFIIGKTPEGEGHFGFRFQPYCASTPSYCTSYSNSSMSNFLVFMNNAEIYTFFPQNRFDPENKRLIGNLVYQSVNINRFYMNRDAAMEQTIFLDEARILDDTENYFVRKQAKLLEQGLTINPNTPYPISKMFQSSVMFYDLKVKHSTLSYNYLISTIKTDSILALIGGILVVWYAICHWLAKAYNNYCVRTAHADAIYGQSLTHDYFLKKLVALSPIPLCLIPQYKNTRNQITRMRLVDKKVLNQLNYLWLIKSVNNIFQLSASPLKRIQQKHLSMVFVKQKINQSDEVYPEYPRPVKPSDQQFIELHEEGNNQLDQKMLGKKKNKNKVFNDSDVNVSRLNRSGGILMSQSIQQKSLEKIKALQQQQPKIPSETKQYFNDNLYHGQPKPMPLGWLDTFEYPASLTFKGRREVTSCIGGCFSILLTILIILVVSFQLSVYFDRGDAKTGKSTSVIQPLQSQSNQTVNTRIYLQTGADFKLAVTFSTTKYDVFQNVSKYLNNGTGISIFQKKLMKNNGVISATIVEYPLNPCPQGYLTDSLSSIVDKSYFDNEILGYCVPDGLRLEISGLPQDSQRNSFTLSIYNKLNTDEGRDNIRQLLHNYYPKFHFSVPNKDFNKQQITYQITSLIFDPYNITTPVQQNISLSKTIITYDNRIGFNEDPQTVQTYSVNAFHQYDSEYSGLATENMYYNLTFDNSFLVEHYTLRDDKFYETFGIVGGLIAFFIFGFGCIPRAYNTYRMKYLIGRQLYLFDMSKAKMKKNAARGRKKKSQAQAAQMEQINYFSEFNIFRAFLLSYLGNLAQNYNFDEVLRRVTLIQQKVEKDINLIEVYRKIHSFKQVINERHRNTYCDVSSLFLKPIYNDTPELTNLQGQLLAKIDGYSRKHKWTEFQRQAVSRAFENGVKLRTVFDNKFLERQFNLAAEQTDNASRIDQTEIAPTNSILESASRREQFSQIEA